jgi:F-type H+-transporting ATPase subunit beta
MSKVTGKVAQIVGPVIDVEFATESELPKIYDSLEIKKADGSILVLEVQSHIGEDMVRTIAMDSSDGLSRGTEVVQRVYQFTDKLQDSKIYQHLLKFYLQVSKLSI